MHKNVKQVAEDEIGGGGAAQYEGCVSSIICIENTPVHCVKDILISENKKGNRGEDRQNAVASW